LNVVNSDVCTALPVHVYSDHQLLPQEEPSAYVKAPRRNHRYFGIAARCNTEKDGPWVCDSSGLLSVLQIKRTTFSNLNTLHPGISVCAAGSRFSASIQPVTVLTVLSVRCYLVQRPFEKFVD
jgi:hypothetical protein